MPDRVTKQFAECIRNKYPDPNTTEIEMNNDEDCDAIIDTDLAEFPDLQAMYPQLRTLKLYGYDVVQIPTHQNVKELVVGRTSSNTEGLLPRFHFPNLETLTLDEIDDDLSNLRLPPTVTAIYTNSFLRSAGHQFDEISTLPSRSHIKTLHIDGRQDEDMIEEDNPPISDRIGTFTHLEHLHLEGILGISPAIGDLTHLKTLELWGNDGLVIPDSVCRLTQTEMRLDDTFILPKCLKCTPHATLPAMRVCRVKTSSPDYLTQWMRHASPSR